MTTTPNSLLLSSQSTEKLSTAGPARPSCIACGLLMGCKTPFLRPWIPMGWTGKILGVGEAPGKDEDEESGRPFTGPSGRLLYRMLKLAGFDAVDIALVNAVRCRPTRNATPSMRQVRACRPFLLRVVEQLRPRVVVAFGAVAVKGLLDRGSASVTAFRGRVQTLNFEGTPGPDGSVRSAFSVPVRVTYHPAAILRGATHLQKRVVQDLSRIRKVDRRDLEIVSTLLADKVVAIDTEYSPHGDLLSVALAGSTEARVWDVEGNNGAVE